MAGSRRRRKLVPECDPAIRQMVAEFASEIGIPSGLTGAGFNSEMAGELGGIGGGSSGGRGYMGYITARDAGFIGGSIVKRLIQQAEQETQQTIR